MSSAENHNSENITSSDNIIDDVIDSCNKLDLDNNDNKKDDTLVKNIKNQDAEEDYIDETYLKDLDVSSSLEEIKERKKLAIENKEFGNNLFKDGHYEIARKKYTESLRICPLEFKEERAILYANRSAAKMKEGMKKEAIEDCTKAVELNPKYVKAYVRRAKLYEEEEKLDEALEDYKNILDLDPDNREARIAVMRLPAQINERNEKLKAEMLGSLKELGNKLLKPFGLSTDNFQVQQDPNSGGYSINFTQNRK